jgi:5-formyltetrahydrofolate cyclo-ligase
MQLTMQVKTITGIITFVTFLTMSCDMAAAAASKKVAIRNHIKEVLKNISQDEIAEKSAAIVSRLCGMPEYRDSTCVCLYLSMPAGEVQSYELLQQAFTMKKRVFIPKVTGKRSEDLKIFEIENYSTISGFPKSKWGIPEPPKEFSDNAVDATHLGLVDCVIMPGVAFDSQCARIGHGKGYYGECFFSLFMIYSERALSDITCNYSRLLPGKDISC